MKNKQLFNKAGNPVTVKDNRTRRLDGRWEMNVKAVSSEKLAKECGLYEYETNKLDPLCEKRGKLVFDEKTGTCTHEKIKRSDPELAAIIEANNEAQLRAEFEAEQEAAKEAAFAAFKAKKTDKKKLN